MSRLLPVEGSLKLWHPWQLKQLKAFQAKDLSMASRSYFFLEYVLFFIQSGTAQVQYHKRAMTFRALGGTFFVCEPGEPLTCQPQNLTFLGLCIDSSLLKWAAREFLQREKSLPHFPLHGLYDPSLSRAMSEFVANSQAPISRLQRKEVLLQILAPLLLNHAEGAGRSPVQNWEHPSIKHVKEHLQVHYAEEVTLQDLASVANLSPFHLSRVFSQTVGLSPHAYQTQLRLARARALLAQGFSVDYVATEIGFYDQSHFTQQFKRHFYITPGAYRKAVRFS
ncbi:AraC family transcriptional regulator [Ktedonosporobacter rubrisoli]|uniref:AraC family transcriptional regulator n=1 Tax=Ktedonosporobacter rubrisoli TaxID=2509675 RepID=A0A4P6JW03_KTERU|nr:AraC family transcriptional regulator [Ktedonosporobacter rubrisoli]QBD79858.1 AraC family transcriptional regulator [Ktedonosporobacter rubrisoli]